MSPSPFARNLFLRTGNRCGSFMSKIVRSNHRWPRLVFQQNVVFLRSIWGICVTSLLYSNLFFFIYRAFEKISNEGSRACVSNGENFRIVHLFFFFFLFLFLSKIEYVWNINCIEMDGRYEWIIDVRFYCLKVINEKMVCSYWSWHL